MSDDQEKMHLMISSKVSKNEALKHYQAAVEKYKFAAIRTIRDAMRNDCLPIGKMNQMLTKSGEPEHLKNIIEYLIGSTSRSFNLTRNLDLQQISEVTETIRDEFYYLKLSEVFFILKQAKMGRTEKTYERMDEPTIISWFDSYVAERNSIAIEKSLQEHDRYTAGEKERQYEGLIGKMHREQSGAEKNRINNIAFAMAKKMMTNTDNISGPYRANKDKSITSGKKETSKKKK